MTHQCADLHFIEGVIKYLFNYDCKGPDLLTSHLKANNEVVFDEPRNYQYRHYSGAPETVWNSGVRHNLRQSNSRTFGCESFWENTNIISWRQGKKSHKPTKHKPKLTMWFAAIRKLPNGRHFKYDQFPSCFRWVRAQRKWMPKQSMIIKKTPRDIYEKKSRTLRITSSTSQQKKISAECTILVPKRVRGTICD